jgi:isopentenyl diphosphate isomerase/L-lactate dehydrogenase-like FMN-dependent dehydrogenase
LFFIIKWIFPSTADSILTWAKTVPVKATNWHNTAVLNKDIVLPLEKTDISDEKDSDKIEKTGLENIEVVDIDKKEEKK